jgi:four helix bundle protein
MPNVERFEDLIAWQRARALTKAIYQVTTVGKLAHDRGLCWQLQRASVSVMANIAEGFERTGSAEFQRFATIAKASCAEVRSLLYVALDVGYLERATFDALMNEANEVGNLTGGLRAALARHRYSDANGRKAK